MSYQKIPLILIDLMIITAVAFLETTLFYTGYRFEVSIFLILLGHLFLVSALVLPLFIFWKQERPCSLLAIVTVMTIFAGPFGAVAGIFAILTQLILTLVGSSQLEELLAMVFPEERVNSSSELFERVIYGMEEYDKGHLPISFNDVMTFGTVKQKRTAIERILKFFRPKFAEALFQGLNDSANSIRVLSATAVARINDKFASDYSALEDQLKKEPNHLNLLLKTGKFCEDYAELAFLDDSRKETLHARAIELLEHYDSLNVDSPTVLLSLGRLHCQIENYHEARNYLERLFVKENRIVDEAYKWYFTVLFHEKEYDMIRRFVQRDNLVVSGEGVEHDHIVDQIVVWRRGLPKEVLAKGECFGA